LKENDLLKPQYIVDIIKSVLHELRNCVLILILKEHNSLDTSTLKNDYMFIQKALKELYKLIYFLSSNNATALSQLIFNISFLYPMVFKNLIIKEPCGLPQVLIIPSEVYKILFFAIKMFASNQKIEMAFEYEKEFKIILTQKDKTPPKPTYYLYKDLKELASFSSIITPRAFGDRVELVFKPE